MVRKAASVGTRSHKINRTGSRQAVGKLVGKHLKRLWARDETLRLAAQRKGDEAVKLAAKNQLVTSLTGAVVLETKEQYDRHNLKAADPMTVPTIPEPSIMSLIGIIAAMFCYSRRKRR
jgi:hypothetical protein